MCFVLPALAILFKEKVSLVIEPVVAFIVNQAASYRCFAEKGFNALALGRTTGNKKSFDYRQVLQSTRDKSVVITAMSITLTSKQISLLQKSNLHSSTVIKKIYTKII